MQFQKPRKETKCLNCGAEVLTRFCPECGQENVEQVSSIGGLIVGLITKFTHLDGKFVSTFKELILRPGFVAYEFVNFRRRKYIDPLSLFFTVSALSILITLYLDTKDQSKYGVQNNPGLKHLVDSAFARYLTIDSFTSCAVTYNHHTSNVYAVPFLYRRGEAYYDSVQNTMPVEKRSNWLKRHYEIKLIHSWNEYERDPYSIDHKAQKNFYTPFANFMLISMGLFSTLLYILNIRRKEGYTFFSHFIFSLNYFTVAWVFLTLQVLMQYAIGLAGKTDSNSITLLIILVGLLLYLFFAMRRFYRQSYLITGIKFIILAAVFVMLFVASALMIFVYSMFNIAGS